MLRALATRANRRQGIALALALLGLAPMPVAEAKKKKKKCPAGQIRCGGLCLDPLTDALNCGQCGVMCTGATPSCCGGVCVDTTADPLNCRSCGTRCPTTTATCCDSTCRDLRSDPQHCGECGTRCPATAPKCDGGSCRSSIRGVCLSDGDCYPERGMICGTISSCDLSGSRCCMTANRACSLTCDCCGNFICHNGACRNPADVYICRHSPQQLVSCPTVPDACCFPEFPWCCPETQSCCGKGAPVCCPPISSWPNGYCCGSDYYCCSTGCCRDDRSGTVSVPGSAPSHRSTR